MGSWARGIAVAASLVLCLAVCLAAGGSTYADPARLSPSLTYLADKLIAEKKASPHKPVPPVSLSLRFESTLTEKRILELEDLGVHFDRPEGKVEHLGPVYRVRLPAENVSLLRRLDNLEWAEADWKPGLVPTMNISRSEIGATQAWGVSPGRESSLTGTGVLIADFDTGIDVFHPAFWFVNGDTVAWVDINESRRFEPGVDGADFNGDGLIAPDEILRFWDGKVEDEHDFIPNNFGRYEADRDWLYRDLNGNGQRDAGLDRGFSEANPTFGEPVFVIIDRNGDNTLDLGESLVCLGTCKVRAILESGDKVRRRSRDLIWAGRDQRGHGTSVAGVLVGESPGRLLAGVAPGAELIVADAFAGTPLSRLILWAQEEKADVMLYQLANWVWDYMDGSSNVERMIDLAAAKGAVQVVSAGNLAGSGKHCRAAVGTDETAGIRMRCPDSEDTRVIWVSILWRADEKDLQVRLESPWGNRVTLSGSGAGTFHGIRYWSTRGTSPRGTAGLFFSIESDMSLGGDWVISVRNSGDPWRVD